MKLLVELSSQVPLSWAFPHWEGLHYQLSLCLRDWWFRYFMSLWLYYSRLHMFRNSLISSQFSICWHIAVCSNLWWFYFCRIHCSISFFLSDFTNLVFLIYSWLLEQIEYQICVFIFSQKSVLSFSDFFHHVFHFCLFHSFYYFSSY